jgi:small GTP-binding protein
MFSLLHGCLEHILRKEELHILILGLDKAGKTTLLEKIKELHGLPGLEWDKILPTVGLNVGRIEAHNCLLIFWDLGGQLGLRSIWDKYYDEAHAVVYVVDAADAARVAESKAALDKVLGHRDLVSAPLLVLANKQVRCLLRAARVSGALVRLEAIRNAMRCGRQASSLLKAWSSHCSSPTCYLVAPRHRHPVSSRVTIGLRW